MGQLIACAAADGVLVATDSRAVFFEPYGEERFINLDRLVPVTSHVVLASAGAVEAHDLCQGFASFAKAENLTEMDALIQAAIPFFTSRYDEILRKMCESARRIPSSICIWSWPVTPPIPATCSSFGTGPGPPRSNTTG